MDTFYETVGGARFFEALVADFYRRVELDTNLRGLYPQDLSNSIRWMTMFLSQYFGGPGTYSEQKGHPRLRMRHAHIKIGATQRDAWWNAMRDAVAASGIQEPHRSAMLEYFTTSADWMINHDEQATTEA